MSVVSGIGGKLVGGNSLRTLHPSLKLVNRRTVQIHTIARNLLCGKTPRQEKKCLKRALPTYSKDLCSMMKFMDWIIDACIRATQTRNDLDVMPFARLQDEQSKLQNRLELYGSS